MIDILIAGILLCALLCSLVAAVISAGLATSGLLLSYRNRAAGVIAFVLAGMPAAFAVVVGGSSLLLMTWWLAWLLNGSLMDLAIEPDELVVFGLYYFALCFFFLGVIAVAGMAITTALRSRSAIVARSRAIRHESP